MSHQADIMPRKLVERRNRIIYPLSVTQLDQRDLTSIVEILLIDSEKDRAKVAYLGQYRGYRTSKNIKTGIQTLRWQLQANAMFRLLFGPSKIVLCEVHKGFNPWIIHSLFELLVKEVTSFLDELYWFLEYLKDDVKEMLRALNSIAGMWWCPKSRHDLPPFHAKYYQENRCEACMLARVVAKAPDLQNLHATLLSRTREDRSEKHPELQKFVEVAISITGFTPDMLRDGMGLAARARAARKAARKFARKQMKGPRPMRYKGKKKRSHCITIQLKAETPEEAEKERKEILEMLARLKGEPSEKLDDLANDMAREFKCDVERTVNAKDEKLPDYADNEQVSMHAPSHHRVSLVSEAEVSDCLSENPSINGEETDMTPAPSYHSNLNGVGSQEPPVVGANSLNSTAYCPPTVATGSSNTDQATDIRSRLGDDEPILSIIEEARRSSDRLQVEAKSNGSAIPRLMPDTPGKKSVKFAAPRHVAPVHGSRLPQNFLRFRTS
ncbi:hypothetical protein AtubIFM56815_009798 [Aspergillus tubingensis]|uniref:Uncharacterized protein n=2 Tax=Aspergillus subgen. Circumdati TaxID=2720871 RepID=A0A9W6ENI6_ASPTU|nr:similar to An01g10020 [Aspergillus niger]GLA64308.1 hypothetical protein AtubIFM54640_006023 [Aspergillus tubingensis]GLA85560.1 hypothetical protein AtubIFM56815_009798 [Aspergillus tubingensis]GLB15538.1 hypothetical protein AtubIFM61612_005361 [Aspergillus tubingensis]